MRSGSRVTVVRGRPGVRAVDNVAERGVALPAWHDIRGEGSGAKLRVSEPEAPEGRMFTSHAPPQGGSEVRLWPTHPRPRRTVQAQSGGAWGTIAARGSRMRHSLGPGELDFGHFALKAVVVGGKGKTMSLGLNAGFVERAGVRARAACCATCDRVSICEEPWVLWAVL